MVSILAIFPPILLLLRFSSEQIAEYWVDEKWSGKILLFVRGRMICPTSVQRGFWVGGQAKSLVFSLF
jgi:hypothetical protein